MQLRICSPGHENINAICPGTIGIVLQIWPIDTEKGKITEILKNNTCCNGKIADCGSDSKRHDQASHAWTALDQNIDFRGHL